MRVIYFVMQSLLSLQRQFRIIGKEFYESGQMDCLF